MPISAGVTMSFRQMVTDGPGDRDNRGMVNYYRQRKS